MRQGAKARLDRWLDSDLVGIPDWGAAGGLAERLRAEVGLLVTTLADDPTGTGRGGHGTSIAANATRR